VRNEKVVAGQSVVKARTHEVLIVVLVLVVDLTIDCSRFLKNESAISKGTKDLGMFRAKEKEISWLLSTPTLIKSDESQVAGLALHLTKAVFELAIAETFR
jgi:hypothetical protein